MKQSSSVVREQVPISTEEMKTSGVDTSGFGMYSSGTGTGAITAGGLLPGQYVTTPTAIQTPLPFSPVSVITPSVPFYSEDDENSKEKGTEQKVVLASDAAGMTPPHHDKKGLMERIKEKLPGHHHHH